MEVMAKKARHARLACHRPSGRTFTTPRDVRRRPNDAHVRLLQQTKSPRSLTWVTAVQDVDERRVPDVGNADDLHPVISIDDMRDAARRLERAVNGRRWSRLGCWTSSCALASCSRGTLAAADRLVQLPRCLNRIASIRLRISPRCPCVSPWEPRPDLGLTRPAGFGEPLRPPPRSETSGRYLSTIPH
jgi:hypothetical protein